MVLNFKHLNKKWIKYTSKGEIEKYPLCLTLFKVKWDLLSLNSQFYDIKAVFDGLFLVWKCFKCDGLMFAIKKAHVACENIDLFLFRTKKAAKRQEKKKKDFNYILFTLVCILWVFLSFPFVAQVLNLTFLCTVS